MLDQETARALVDAGYMPLRDYITSFGNGIQSVEQTLAMLPLPHAPRRSFSRKAIQTSLPLPARPLHRRVL